MKSLGHYQISRTKTTSFYWSTSSARGQNPHHLSLGENGENSQAHLSFSMNCKAWVHHCRPSNGTKGSGHHWTHNQVPTKVDLNEDLNGRNSKYIYSWGAPGRSFWQSQYWIWENSTEGILQKYIWQPSKQWGGLQAIDKLRRYWWYTARNKFYKWMLHHA